MEAFDTNLQALEALLAAFQDVAKAESAELRCERNDVLPISKIPLETLVDILEADLDRTWNDLEVDQRPARIGTLSSVSKAWNEIVQCTPSLWSKIHTKYPLQFIRTTVERSGKHGTIIGGPLTNRDPKGLESTLSTCSQVRRWSSAKVTADSDAVLDLLTYSAAPALHTLQVSCLQPAETIRRPINLFNGEAPKLVDVEVEGLSAVWASPIFTGLGALTLSDVHGLTRSQFFGILRACPLLQQLILNDLTFSPPGLGSEEPVPISLLSLERLRVRDCPVEVLQDISAQIDCPAANEIVLAIPSLPRHAPPDPHLAALQPVVAFTIDFIQRRLEANTYPLDLVWRPTSYSFSFGGYTPDPFRLWLENMEDTRVLDKLVQDINTKSPLEFNSLNISGQDKRGGWRSMGNLDGVQDLLVIGTKGVVSWLGRPSEGDAALRWPLRNIHTVFIDGATCGEADEVVKMVQGRQGCLHSVPTTPKQLPVPLENLFMGAGCNVDKLTVMKLKTILPEADVYWGSLKERSALESNGTQNAHR